MSQRETGQVRGGIGVGLLALGLCVGLLVGMAVAPRSGADVRRMVAQYMHDATTMLGMAGQAREELAEDLAS